MRSPTPGIAALLMLGVFLSGCASSERDGRPDPASDPADVVEIRLVMQDDGARPFVFSPERIRVPVGTTVRFLNAADIFHTVTSTETLDVRQPDGLFDANLAAEGEAFSYTFDEEGTFTYYCKPHVAFMTGTIEVGPAGTPVEDLRPGPGQGADERDRSTPPPPGAPIASEDVIALAGMFTDGPFRLVDGATPGYVFHWIGPETFLFLHLDRDDPREARDIQHVGIGVRGVFCADDRPGGSDGGFSHFRAESALDWRAARGGAAGTLGYWFLHIAAHGDMGQGVDHAFDPTEPSSCQAMAPRLDSALPSQGSAITSDEAKALLAWFDEAPFLGGLPQHAFKWLDKERFLFLQTEDGTAIRYIGVGVPGTWCASTWPHEDFASFEAWDRTDPPAETAPGDHGYWMLHAAVATFSGAGGDVPPGLVPNGGLAVPPCGTDAADTNDLTRGTALTADRVQLLMEAFDDQTMTGQGSPQHIFKWVNEDVSVFLHVDSDEVADATRVLYAGIAVRGAFCPDDQPEGKDGAFPHFHRYEAPTFHGGHGGEPGAGGHWWMHAAVAEFDQPWGHESPGVSYGFMPTPASQCPAGSPSAGYDAEDAGPLSADERATFVRVFDDRPFTGGQTTPAHLFFWVNEDVFVFLHFDGDDPATAANVLYYGMGVRGTFCTDDRPHTDFAHFHRASADSWEAGHGGAAGDEGFWMMHAAVTEAGMPWGEVKPGIDRGFMPTPPSACA